MSKRNQSPPRTKEKEQPNYVLIAAIIGAFTTIVAALITVFGSIKQSSLPLEATRTAEALHTLIAMTAQVNLPNSTDIPASTVTPAYTFTSIPSPTLTVENQLIQLIDNYYTCLNIAHPDFDNDYEKCWNLLSDRPGEFQDNFNRSNAGFGLETFISFWKDYKVTYSLYFCPKGSEKFVDAQYDLYKRSDLSVSVGKYFLEYSFALDSKGWRIKAADSISGIGSYCESQPRVEKNAIVP
jgi:hypothetical protein